MKTRSRRSRAQSRDDARHRAVVSAAGQCRMSPQAWKRFERYAWLDAAQGEFRLMLRIEGARFSVSRKGAADYTKQLRQWLGREGRILPEEETKP